MTFSNAKVAERVNSRFVPVWFNRGRGFHNCERRTEKWIYESAGEAYPTKNICTFFLTPDLEVVYYVAGYYAPEMFLDVLGAVEELRGAEGVEFTLRHRRLSAALAATSVDVPRYRDLRHAHGKACARAVEAGLKHRRAVHDAFATSGPVPLDQVQHDYLFGNSFTEELPRGEATPTGEFPRPRVATR